MQKSDSLTISLLSEYLYCPRSFIYRYFDFKPLENENVYIADGRLAHSKSDSGHDIFDRKGRRVHPRYPVFSRKLNICGIVDRVIFYPKGAIVAIEEKRGRIRENKQIEMQLALELYCLMEMFPEAEVKGSIYFADSRRHRTIEFVKSDVEKFVARVRFSIRSGADVFEPVLDHRCDGCMFRAICGAA